METFEIHSARDIALRGIVFSHPKEVRAVVSLVHGFGEHCGRYKDMATFLAKHGIATVGLDLRGHGRSGGKRGVVRNYDEFSQDLSHLLETSRAAFPDIPHVLYGHSMGGGLVLNYMIREKPDDIRAVIASAPLLKLATPPPTALKGLMRIITAIVPDFSVSQPVKGEAISTLPKEQALYVNDPLTHGTLGGRLALAMMARGSETLDAAQTFPKPLLVLHSEDDVLTDFSASKTFSEKAPHGTFVPYAGVAHEMHNDTSRPLVYQTMLDFIERSL